VPDFSRNYKHYQKLPNTKLKIKKNEQKHENKLKTVLKLLKIKASRKITETVPQQQCQNLIVPKIVLAYCTNRLQ
jgi:hypothetical protein